MLNIRKATLADCDFVKLCRKQLVSTEISDDIFQKYFSVLLDQQSACVDVWIANVNNIPAGYIVANKFSIPRYLGFGVELEEVVIMPEFQRKGYGEAFILYLIDHYSGYSDCRKIAVKTDDDKGSGKLYKKLMAETRMKFYQQFLNKI